MDGTAGIDHGSHESGHCRYLPRVFGPDDPDKAGTLQQVERFPHGRPAAVIDLHEASLAGKVIAGREVSVYDLPFDIMKDIVSGRFKVVF